MTLAAVGLGAYYVYVYAWLLDELAAGLARWFAALCWLAASVRPPRAQSHNNGQHSRLCELEYATRGLRDTPNRLLTYCGDNIHTSAASQNPTNALYKTSLYNLFKLFYFHVPYEQFFVLFDVLKARVQ